MFRSTILTVTALFALASAAYAEPWGVNAVMYPKETGSFTLVDPSGGTSSTKAFFVIPDGTGSAKVRITAAEGLCIGNVIANRVKQPAAKGLEEYTVTLGSPSNTAVSHVVPLVVSMVPKRYNVTTIPAPGLGITSGFKNVKHGNATKKIRITPKRGFIITQVIGLIPGDEVLLNGETPITPSADGDVDIDPKQYLVVKLAPVVGPRSLTASAAFRYFADAMILPEQAAGQFQEISVVEFLSNPTNFRIILDGSRSRFASSETHTYTWSVVGNPAGASVEKAKSGTMVTDSVAMFRATLPGDYRVQLRVTDGPNSSDAFYNIRVTPYVTSTGCSACHTAKIDPVYGGSIVANFQASVHKARGYECSACHGHHDFTTATLVRRPESSVCQGCHDGTTARKHADSGCLACHNPHSSTSTGGSGSPTGPPHYANLSAATVNASYVTPRSSCSDCHVSSDNNHVIRVQWKGSAHGNTIDAPWMGQDFKMQNGCVRCHTTTGFIAYSTGKNTAAWGSADDRTKEVLRCDGCHSDVAAGILRRITPAPPYPSDPFVLPELGKSNICTPCHAGVASGAAITARLQQNPDFSSVGIVDPHFLASAGTLSAVAGYEFPGRSYSGAATHFRIGSNAEGPCISCHKAADTGHAFTATAANPVCAGCHISYGDAGLAADRALFLDALQVLKAQLAAAGIDPGTTTNWGSGQEAANRMGAAFNYLLFSAEPGAFAHNPAYARELIVDSIDYLDNGQLDDSVESLAIPALMASQAISGTVAQGATTYKTKNTCTSCHGGTASSSSPMATAAHPAHLTRAYGPGAYLGSALSSCQSCHPFGNATHLNGQPDVIQGSGSACVACHPGSVPAWGTTARIACTSCHGATASVLPNGVAAPTKTAFSVSGHGRFGGSNECIDCHDANSSHIDGSRGTTARLLLPNDNGVCASCHNDSGVVRARFLGMSTHRDDTGAALRCNACHDPHGTGNSSMIRSTINGLNVSFGGSDFVHLDGTGICQVCHTKTTHYRGAEPENDHPMSGCLNCHRHNAAGGAFAPTGGACDSCHGYPPAPRDYIFPLAFGFPGSWEAARFEDYSGGGGAHLVAQHVSPNAKPSEGWANCTICHNGGKTEEAPYHQMTMPLSSHISNVTVDVDRAVRFDNSFTIYTGAQQLNPPAVNTTGSCFNIACHISESPRWSIER